MDQQANAFSLFQTAIGLEAQVRIRTEELKSALEKLGGTNDELTTARDAAERANRFKTRFFTAVGHDLLQPLHAARLSLSAMAEDTSGPARARLAQQIDHALTTIEELLRTLLDLSKLEAGVTTPMLQPVSLGDIFDGLVLDFEPLAKEKSLTLGYRATDMLVRSDPAMLRRILQNFVANAVHYTQAGRVHLRARPRDAGIRIEVWDTGPGIEAAERERIFEEFQRGAASERSHTGGFGLGLSIAQRMAAALGHEVGLCSIPGHGTRFSVTAPFAGRLPDSPSARDANAPPRLDARAAQAYGFADARMIMIDNDAAVLNAMRTMLGAWSCEGRFASRLSDIEQILCAEPDFAPQIVLADYHLDAGVTGLDAIRAIRAHHGADVPAIVITADHSHDVTERVTKAGCEILRKPVRPAELRALMQHLLGR